HGADGWRLVVAPPPGERHGFLLIELGATLRAFVREHTLGRIVGGSGFVLRREGGRPSRRCPRCCGHRYRHGRRRRSFTNGNRGAPDLAVEVVSPSDRRAYVQRKVEACLDAGTARIWLVWPDRREVTVHRRSHEPVTLGLEDVLTSDDAGFAVEGFALP